MDLQVLGIDWLFMCHEQTHSSAKKDLYQGWIGHV